MQMHILAILWINAYNAYFKDFEPINAYFGDLKKKYAYKILNFMKKLFKRTLKILYHYKSLNLKKNLQHSDVN